jgi:hypothetical protein
MPVKFMLYLRSIFLGILTAAFALIWEIFFFFSPEMDYATLFTQLSWTLFFFALLEETLKFFVIQKNFSETTEKKSSLNFFGQALLIGFGFALTEIFLANFFSSPESPLPFLSLLSLALLHITSAGLMGYLSLIFPEKNAWLYPKIILPAVLLHFAYNALVIYSVAFWPLAIFLTAFLLFFALKTPRIPC